MNVQILSKKLIRPSVPTPSHLQNMRISFMDQLGSPRTVPNIFYYSNVNENCHADASEQVDDVTMTIPSFVSGILFPPRDIDISRYKPPQLSKSKSDQVVTKRIVFDANTISKLKADQATRLNCKPSTTEVLIALIWRAQINAARARHGRLRTSLLSVAMNMRGRKFKKIPENCCGNLLTRVTARFDQENERKIMGLNEFVDQGMGAIRNSIMEYAKVVIEGDDEDEFFSKLIMKPYMEIFEEIRKGEGDVHVFSSLRNLPFYEVDFGWGKPAWVSFAHRVNKGVVFIDAKDGDGIEAWVHMEENEMAYFLKDPNIVMSMELSSRNAHKRNLPPETVVGSIEEPHVTKSHLHRL
ncbi:hypothetical protein ACOSP7_005593 [Xanthoceras sorbifolium]|uniref:Uncharacterized protein n=1 Tax=Xanthoceras sorbifolium TaxID=99658 RepID=A0ABQ8IED5_9ROSI|nr:hypothetical protein JRO89_XS02G0037900 [Xanthoceras sorbifolium]